MKARRAVSLVELLLAMSACTVILTMSAALIHRVMHTQSKTRSFFEIERSALRLANQFRRDVHQASGAFAADADSGEDVFLRLQLPGDQTVEYRHRQGKVLRVLREGGKVLAREEFVFPPDIELAVRKDSPRLVILSITSQRKHAPADGATPRLISYMIPVNFQVAATLDRDTSFVRALTGREDAP